MRSSNGDERLPVPEDGYGCGFQAVHALLSGANPFPRPSGSDKRVFQPIRPLKTLVIICGFGAVISGCALFVRGALFPVPLASNAPLPDRIIHGAGARYARPVVANVLMGGYNAIGVTLTTAEADLRANYTPVSAPKQRQLTPEEIKMLDDVAGDALFVNWRNP